MRVKRIVPNVEAKALGSAKEFYGGLLGLEIIMDHGWIVTFGGDDLARPQISIATQGGSDTAVPDVSIEVDDLEEALERFQSAGVDIEYGPADEPWGVRRFYVRDPLGRLINILTHS